MLYYYYYSNYHDKDGHLEALTIPNQCLSQAISSSICSILNVKNLSRFIRSYKQTLPHTEFYHNLCLITSPLPKKNQRLTSF